jgi:hypothetical protein
MSVAVFDFRWMSLQRNTVMALFLQLLSENELRELSVEELKALKVAFYHTLYTNETIKRELGATVSQTLQTIRQRRQASQP